MKTYKISKTLKGRALSLEHRRKVSEGMKRVSQNPEVKKKMSLRMMGNKYNLGKKLSEEMKRAISKRSKEQFSNPEIRKKLSIAGKKRYSNTENRKIHSIIMKDWWNKRRGVV